MNKIFPLLLCLLMACAQKNNNEQSVISADDKINITGSDSLSDPEIQTIQDTVEFVRDKSRVINLINILNKIDSPIVVGEYKNNKPDSLWKRIPDGDIKHLIPKDAMEDVQGEVYGIGKFSNNNIFGVLYYIEFPSINPEDVDEVLNKTILVLYNPDHGISDYKIVGIRDYGLGFSKIYNLEKVIYLYTSESENRNITKEEFLIENGKFIEKARNSVDFKSTSQDDEKYHDYIENAFK